MNYEESLNYISSTYVMGIKLGLENIRRLMAKLGDPQKKMKIIHVAGTNGKGSTCAMLSSILKEAGYRVGLYTSPYLEVFNERIRIDGENIGDEQIATATTRVKEVVEQLLAEGYSHPTEFEITTAIGFLCFEQAKVDFLVLEVGMGGRFDATNVVESPCLTIITSISIDHEQYLGDTLTKIAYEKAGILKERVPLILYPQQKEAEKEILKIAEEKSVPVISVFQEKVQIRSSSLQGQRLDMQLFGEHISDITLKLLGAHQASNALTAATAIWWLKKNRSLRMDEQILRSGMKSCKWPGRLELMSTDPITMIDGAHNPDGAKVLLQTIQTLLSDREITLVLGMLRDKDIEQITDLLIPHVTKVVTVTPNSDRAMPAEELAVKLQKYKKTVETGASIEESVQRARRITHPEKGAILYAGSLYMIGEVRSYLTKSDYFSLPG